MDEEEQTIVLKLDSKERLIFKQVVNTDLGSIREWYYSYDDKGDRVEEKYIEEMIPVDYTEHI
tara:strand:+ start:1748 stop:1936 length:189 start_codon:yes stop_codon:yes gene_type:complete